MTGHHVLSFQQLEHLWIRAHGSPALAPVMAAIATAESSAGARPLGDHYRGQGFTSFGLWQVHTRDQNACLVNTLPGSVPYNEHRLVVDAAYNARAAVAIEHRQGLGAWSTFADKSYRRFLPKAIVHAQHAHRSAPHHRAHVAHPQPIAAQAIQALNLVTIDMGIAGILFVSWQLMRRAKRVMVTAAREEMELQRRMVRRRAYRSEAALKKRTMPRNPRKLALNEAF